MTPTTNQSAPDAGGAHGGLASVLGSNLEAIAIFRMTFGALLLVELVSRYQYLLPFYSDEGTLPLRLLYPKIDTLYSAACVHCYDGSMMYLTGLLTVQVGLAMMFIVGYKTRLASIGSWFLYLSLSLRNTWLNFILDRYFHHLLFYSMFLPLDGAWAIDSRRRGSSKATFVTPATIALKLLVVWIYLDAGYGKFSDPLQGWTLNAKPLPALDTYVRHTVGARYMYSLLGPEGLKLMTPTVPVAEMFSAPIALIASYLGQKGVVYGTIVLMCFMHIGIAVTMRNTVLLSLVACTAWAIFLPASVGADLGLASRSQTNKSTEKNKHSIRRHTISGVFICVFVLGSLWFETLSSHCNQSMKHIWSTLLHNRWNVFIGAEEYVTWEIAPGRLADGSIVDVWSKTDTVSWEMPGTGAPCTSTARAGRWRSYPYLAELDGEDGEVLWNYLCKQWDDENGVNPDNPDKKLLRFNFFMLQADVKPNMGFSATRKRLIHSHDCLSESNFDENASSEADQLPFELSTKTTKDEL